MVDHYAAGADEQAPKVGACHVFVKEVHAAVDPVSKLHIAYVFRVTRQHSSRMAFWGSCCICYEVCLPNACNRLAETRLALHGHLAKSSCQLRAQACTCLPHLLLAYTYAHVLYQNSQQVKMQQQT